ncbi:MAG: hypothetical protein UIC45_05930 [Paludibacteraceae bacterium]|jgi:hypothetical protein|nr:hypothetical protein [Paludibacteraceae bacterium]
MRKIYNIVIVLIVCLSSCAPNHKEQAENILLRASSLYTSDSLNSAKILIDSIHSTYPNEVQVRKSASELMYKIEYKENTRNLVYFDSVLLVIKERYKSIAKDFTIADTTYSSKRVYIHKKRGKNYYPRTSLLAEVEENGDLILISVYSGKKIAHDSLKVSFSDLYASTRKVPTSSAYNYSFTDLGVNWEYVTFTEETLNDVYGFIFLYSDKLLTVSLYGDKKYSYFLENEDKDILIDTFYFAQVKKELYLVEKKIKTTKNKIQWLEEKLN